MEIQFLKLAGTQLLAAATAAAAAALSVGWSDGSGSFFAVIPAHHDALSFLLPVCLSFLFFLSLHWVIGTLKFPF